MTSFSFRYSLFLSFLFCHLLDISSQPENGGFPYSLKNNLDLKNVPVVIINSNIDKRDTDDPNAFAFAVDTDINPQNSGKWYSTGNNKLLWITGIHSPDAYSLSIFIEPFYLPPETRLFIFNKNYSTITGSFTEKNNSAGQFLSVQFIPGDLVFLEIEINAPSIHQLKFDIIKIGHDYKNLSGIFNNHNLKSAGDCNIDINCPEGSGWEKTKNAVFRITVLNSLKQKYEYCTATLLNNLNNQMIPYFITAGHCLFDETGAQSLVALFGYENFGCGIPNIMSEKSLSGSTIIAHSQELDFTLGKLNEMPPFHYSPYFSGWNSIDETPLKTTSIHHPKGDTKKISHDFDSAETQNYIGGNSVWIVKEWDIGVTEPGSSGAALFNQKQQIVGILSIGDSYCGYPLNDIFIKFSYAYNYYNEPGQQIKFWLNPNQNHVGQINGVDPYEDLTKTCDTLQNIHEDEEISLLPYKNGYYSGHNDDRFDAFAQLFQSTGKKSISALYLQPLIIKTNEIASNLILKVWDYNSAGYPGNVIFEKAINLKNIIHGMFQPIEIGTTIDVENNFFIGYDIHYVNASDKFALYQSSDIQDNTKNYYIFKDNLWQRIDHYTNGSVKGSLQISAVVCDRIPVIIEPKNISEKSVFQIYPNPAKDIIYIKTEKSDSKPVWFYVTDLTGKILICRKLEPVDYPISVFVDHLSPGFYHVIIRNEEKVYNSILIIQ